MWHDIQTISIHPPARGGTVRSPVTVVVDAAISIHPPARGGTVPPVERDGDAVDFNPPTRKGWDRHCTMMITKLSPFQSTHPQGVGPLTSS